VSAPDQLKLPSQLPDDLRALLAELHVPTNDPVLPLLEWIWKQMRDTKTVLESARASTAAVFDNRLEKIKQTAEILVSVDESLRQIDEQLRSKPLQVKEQVEEELAEPIKAAVESCRKLDQQMKSLLQRLDHKVGRTQRALNRALFAAGFTGGGLVVACLFHLLSSH
jgi:DNA anti-recombination protein RmuC